MASLERFFNPQMRPFGQNITSLPGAKLYFYQANSTTPVPTYNDKQGTIPNTNPVIADSNGIFPQIFLEQRLYRVILTDRKNLVQPGWPIDNVGQDTSVVPFGPYRTTVTYNKDEVVTADDGNWYRSKSNNNLGNDVTDTDWWDVIPVPVATNFTSNMPYFSFVTDDGKISLDVDNAQFKTSLQALLTNFGTDFSATSINANEYLGVGSTKAAARLTQKAIVSSTVFEKDTDLEITNVPAGVYKVSGYILWNPNVSGAANGIKVRLGGSNTLIGVTYEGTVDTSGNAPAVATNESSSSINGIQIDTPASTKYQSVRFDGMVSTFSGDSIHVEWAQKTSSITPTVVIRGCITITRVA